jgi:hypothetical protein
MQVDTRFLTGEAVGRVIGDLIDEHDELHWAVAWGSDMPLASRLVANAAKFRNVTFGVAFCQTDPDLVDRLVGLKNCYVATRFAGGTYHPKIYVFRSGSRISAVVGSANFTNGGLHRNLESAVLLEGTAQNPALRDLLTFAERSADFGEPVTPEYAAAYRLAWKRAARMPKPPRDPAIPKKRSVSAASSSSLVSMSWKEFTAEVAKSRHHDVPRSLALLRVAQTWLNSAPSFHDLERLQRKAIAGVIGESQKSGDQDYQHADLDREWGWFGSMRGMGDFANRIEENDRYLARALDSIPQKGVVQRDHYDRFAELFVKAFRNSHRTGGVPTASRLLAMKRPDVFLCVSKPNKTEAARRMGFAKSTLTLENYWERVIEVLQASDWYNVDKPEDSDGPLWECRAAMLDAILYRP